MLTQLSDIMAITGYRDQERLGLCYPSFCSRVAGFSLVGTAFCFPHIPNERPRPEARQSGAEPLPGEVVDCDKW